MDQPVQILLTEPENSEPNGGILPEAALGLICKWIQADEKSKKLKQKNIK